MGAELFHADLLTDRRTDRYDEANSLSSQFRETAQKWRKSKEKVKGTNIRC